MSCPCCVWCCWWCGVVVGFVVVDVVAVVVVVVVVVVVFVVVVVIVCRHKLWSGKDGSNKGKRNYYLYWLNTIMLASLRRRREVFKLFL